MKIAIFGTGYVGLVTGACFAEAGYQVMCVDIDENKVAQLRQGVVPIYEPGLDRLVQENQEAGHLQFSSSLKDGTQFGDFLFIAVGTPPDEDGAADLQYVLAAAESIATHMDNAKIIVNKSTVPVGTADKVREKIGAVLRERGVSHSYDVVSNPEFLKEGSAVADFMKPDRIVIGTGSRETEDAMRELYSPFNRNRDRIVCMDVRSSELTKYAANAMLATKISFMNEISNIAERVGADIENVRLGIGSDPRIGYQFIYPGCGYGGSCFPKDVRALAKTAMDSDYEPRLLQAVEAINKHQKTRLFELILRHFGGDAKLGGKTFALWGLAFKPNTDDMREAPSRSLMEALWTCGARVQAYDPEAMDETQRIYGRRSDLSLMGTKEAALQGADALVVCTEWKGFTAPNFSEMSGQLNDPVIFDGRNLYDPVRLSQNGWTYYGMGRGASCTASRALLS